MRTLLICLSLFGISTWAAERDPYGGWEKVQGRATGFFHTEQIEGRWWMITPEGHGFFIKGVGWLDKEDVGPQLRAWTFNATDGRRKLPGFPYSVTLDLAASTTPNMWLEGIVPDFFSPEFAAAVDRRAREQCSRLAKDPWLIGYFTDNEIRWVPDIRSKDSQLEAFLKKAPESAGRKRALEFLKSRGRKPEELNDDDRLAFLEIAAAQYGRICREAIRRYDPNHLVLGSRFNSLAPVQLSRGLAPYYDVFSFNNYEHRAPLYKLREISRITGKPTFVTEFSFKAMDSGLPNSIGAGDAVETQQDRADLFAAYVEDLARLPTCLGYCWFKYRDQPKEGAGKRSPGGWGGENSNYGLVQMDGTPWSILVDRMTQVNAGLDTLHQ